MMKMEHDNIRRTRKGGKNMNRLEDVAAELKAIAGNLIVLSTTVQPIPKPDGNPSADVTEAAFDSIYHHIVRIADAIQVQS